MSNGPIQTERSKQFAGRPPEPGEQQPGVTPGLQAPSTETPGAVEKVEKKRAKKDEPAPFVLIENTSAKLHGLALPLVSGGQGEGKEFTGIVAVDPKVKLIPGINKVNPADWELAKQQKMVQVHIKAGVFREHLQAKTFADINPADVVRMIPNTFDKKLLEEWKAIDDREESQRLIGIQFDLIKRQHRDVNEDGSGLQA